MSDNDAVLEATLDRGMPVVVTDRVGTFEAHFPRSRSRAKRRAKLGHPQYTATMGRMVILDGRLYVHPVAYEYFKELLEARRTTI